MKFACARTRRKTRKTNTLISKDIKDTPLKNTDIEWFTNTYHNICVNLPKIRALTDKRKKAIIKLMKLYSKEDIEKVFELANGSDFLIGNNDRGWKADIDFILRDDKFVSILEGKYGGKKRSKHAAENIEHLFNGLNDKATKKEGGLFSGEKY